MAEDLVEDFFLMFVWQTMAKDIQLATLETP